MSPVKKKKRQKVKGELNPRNPHHGRYDLKLLAKVHPPLASFVKTNQYKDESIEFADPAAVKALNTALLKQYYGLEYWDVPEGYLCPPIPGRADYIHHIADLLGTSNEGKVPTGEKIRVLDIGVGANCVYPIIGHHAYGWSFVGTEIDKISIDSAQKIIDSNPVLKGEVEIRLQGNSNHVLTNMIKPDEYFDLAICNPPFHSSAAAAEAASLRKVKNLTHKKIETPVLNFGGTNKELWCFGGEDKFVSDMIRQSKQFATSCYWYSCLISKQENLAKVYEFLEKAGATEVDTIPMGQGNKISRIVAWTFLSEAQQKIWRETRWNGKQKAAVKKAVQAEITPAEPVVAEKVARVKPAKPEIVATPEPVATPKPKRAKAVKEAVVAPVAEPVAEPKIKRAKAVKPEVEVLEKPVVAEPKIKRAKAVKTEVVVQEEPVVEPIIKRAKAVKTEVVALEEPVVAEPKFKQTKAVKPEVEVLETPAVESKFTRKKAIETAPEIPEEPVFVSKFARNTPVVPEEPVVTPKKSSSTKSKETDSEE